MFLCSFKDGSIVEVMRENIHQICLSSVPSSLSLWKPSQTEHLSQVVMDTQQAYTSELMLQFHQIMEGLLPLM